MKRLVVSSIGIVYKKNPHDAIAMGVLLKRGGFASEISWCFIMNYMVFQEERYRNLQFILYRLMIFNFRIKLSIDVKKIEIRAANNSKQLL